MELVTGQFGQRQWTEIVSSFRDLSLVQTWEYGEAKSHTGPWKVERAIFVDGQQLVGAYQAMVRSIPYLGGGLVWINRGPLWQRQGSLDISIFLRLLKELRDYWVENQKMYLRIAPTAQQEMADANLFAQCGYSLVDGIESWASARLDLSLPIEKLRSNLEQKWRNCLNKAERLELTCESGTNDDIFRGVLDEYDEMLRERDLKVSAPPPFLIQLQACLSEDRKLWGLIARQGGKGLGGVLIARYGQTCEYLAGAFNESGRNVNAGNLLLWQAICQMKDLGYRWFDLGGMHPVSTPKGIFHFKSGVGASPYRLFGELESYHDGLLNRLIRWRIRRERKS